MLRSRVLVPALVLLGLVALAGPAHAKFRVCNKTQHPTDVAIARAQNGTWISEGWWRVPAQGCQDILSGTLKARYYYLWAFHRGAEGNWDGNRQFCVAKDNFTITGRGDCAKRGYRSAGFFEIDTGEKVSWVQNLSD
jgi:uncharacterized membrane protein